MSLVPPEQIPRIHLLLHVIQHSLIAISDNSVGAFLEPLNVIHDQAAEEGGTVGQGGLVDDHGGALGLDALHDALDAGLAEIVGVGLHGQAVHTYHQRPLLLRVPHGGRGIVTGLVQHTIGDEILSGAVRLHDSRDQILRYILIVCQELLRILR